MTNILTELFSKKDKIKMMKIEDVMEKINPELKSLFKQREETIEAISADMRIHGFDRNRPIVLTSSGIADGHTRLLSAQRAGISLVPVVYRSDLETREQVIEMMRHEQMDRRNLSDKEMIEYVMYFKKKKEEAKSEGKNVSEYSDNAIAARMDISPRQIQKISETIKKCTVEQKAAIESGEKTIAQVHAEIKKVESVNKPFSEKKQKPQMVKLESVIEILRQNLSADEADRISTLIVGVEK